MNTAAVVATTAGVAVALALVGAGIYEHHAHASASSSGGGTTPGGGGGGTSPGGGPNTTGQTVTSLQSGHRYSASLSCPNANLSSFFPFGTNPAADIQANVNQAGLPMAIVSVGISPDGHTATIVIDYKGTQPLPVGSIPFGMPCTTSVTDMGPTPFNIAPGGIRLA